MLESVVFGKVSNTKIPSPFSFQGTFSSPVNLKKTFKVDINWSVLGKVVSRVLHSVEWMLLCILVQEVPLYSWLKVERAEFVGSEGRSQLNGLMVVLGHGGEEVLDDLRDLCILKGFRINPKAYFCLSFLEFSLMHFYSLLIPMASAF